MAQPGKKVFVGSLPNGIDDPTLRSVFSAYGELEDVFIKPNCEPGRQWAFLTFVTVDQAQLCKESCDRILTLPGADKPVDIIFAKNQGMFGQGGQGGSAPSGQHYASPPARVAPVQYAAPPGAMYGGNSMGEGPKKIFVGSLPDGCSEMMLRAEYSKYGHITEVFLKTGCESGRQWAFLTFASGHEAQVAKANTDGILLMPGSVKACEVTFAKNQGMFGQDAFAQKAGSAAPVYATPPSAQGPKKIFVGSLPDFVSEAVLRAEFCKYGQITDVFLKQGEGIEPGRQWAFVTYSTSEAAQVAKDATDRILMLPGSEKACEVTLARNQGKFGQDSMKGGPPAASAPMPYHGGLAIPPGAVAGGQPPPPTAHPPAHLTPWRCYYTAAGLPYYHNHVTNVTQWEAPPELRAAGDPHGHAAIRPPQGARYAPY